MQGGAEAGVPAEGDGAGAGGGQLPLRAAAKRGPRRPHRPPPAANHPTSARKACENLLLHQFL